MYVGIQQKARITHSTGSQPHDHPHPIARTQAFRTAASPLSLRSRSRCARSASDRLFRRFTSWRSLTAGKCVRRTFSSCGQISSDVEPASVTRRVAAADPAACAL